MACARRILALLVAVLPCAASPLALAATGGNINVPSGTTNIQTTTQVNTVTVYGTGTLNFSVLTCTVQSLNGSGGGTVNLDADTVTLAGNGDYSGILRDNNSNATLIINASQLTDSLQLTNLAINGSLQIHSSPTSANTSTLSTLTLAGNPSAWTGALDLTDNALILNPPDSRDTALATLQNEVAYGQTHVAGIFSSALPASTQLAVLDNALLNKSLFANQTLTSNALIVAPTLIGDANADGTVDGDDLQIVLNHFGQPASSWANGNFIGDSTIDLSDLSCVLKNMGMTFTNFTSGTAGASATPSLSNPVPEPATLSLILLAVPLLIRCRIS